MADDAPKGQPTQPKDAAPATVEANAAVALFLLGHRDKVWPLLVHTPDPRVRSFLIHRFATGGAQADDLIARFYEEPDLSARRAMLMSLGEFDRRSVAAEDFETLRQTLKDLIDHMSQLLHPSALYNLTVSIENEPGYQKLKALGLLSRSYGHDLTAPWHRTLRALERT